jgi:hypothetical protein
MKSFLVAGTILVLTGCAGMNSGYSSSGTSGSSGTAGGMNSSGSDPAPGNYNQHEEIFHSWISGTAESGTQLK